MGFAVIGDRFGEKRPFRERIRACVQAGEDAGPAGQESRATSWVPRFKAGCGFLCPIAAWLGPRGILLESVRMKWTLDTGLCRHEWRHGTPRGVRHVVGATFLVRFGGSFPACGMEMA